MTIDHTGSERARTRLALTVLAVCWFAILCDGLDTFVYGAVLPRMLADPALGMSPGAAGTVGSVATLGMLIGALAAGPIADRLGRRTAIVAGVALFSIASLACAVAPSVEVFAAARGVAGLGLGGLIPTAISMVMEYAPRGRANLMVASLMTAHQAGGILAPGLSMLFLDSRGWRFLFLLGGLPLILAVPLMLKFLPESMGYLLARGRVADAEALARSRGVAVADFVTAPTGRGGASSTTAHRIRLLFTGSRAITTPALWTASFAGLLLVYGVATWLPVMMRSTGYELGSALSFLLVINLGGIVGMLIAGQVADRVGPIPTALVWFALTAIGIAALSMQMPLAATYAVVFATGVWLFSAQTMVYAGAAAHSEADFRATAVGLTSGIGRFGAVFGPWLGGVLVASGTPRWGFGAFAVAALLAVAALVVVFVTDRVGSRATTSSVRERVSL
ncbi:MFS transporter [Rhodococcus sp. IEGM 1307]|uniref:MFS transporter n=1 Tax=Rhodococcus sp. IEGM 1307 TaxID=3047091 RepID=UPI0024B6C701|nr:MFS transporter [Rhodococcus sp. IEGM 1307]MDI9979002.1 MFS transporter [Rhodococcus sp. IEGM 1307]